MTAQNVYGTRLPPLKLDEDTTDVSRRGCEHPIEGLKVLCDQCGAFALLQTNYRGRPLIVQISLLVVSAFVVMTLFRVTSLVWPVYLFVGFGLVLLVAVVLSRGKALLAATSILSGFAVVWLLVEINDRYLHAWSGPSDGVGSAWTVGLAMVLGLFTVLAFTLGRRSAVPGLEQTSSYFLAAGVFVFGFWAVWSFLLQNGLVTHRVFQAVLTLAAVAPMPVIAHLLWQGEFDSKGSRFALAFALVSAYVSAVGFIVGSLASMLGTFFPRVLGVGVLEPPDLPWLEVLGWRNLVGAVLLVSALVIVSATSWSEAFDAFRAGRGRGNVASHQQSSGPTNALLALPILAQRLVVQAARYALAFGEFLVKFLLRLAHNLKTIITNLFSYVIKLARHLILPVAAFTAISIFVLLMLTQLRSYDLANYSYSSQAMWGALVSLAMISVVLAGGAFGLAPSRGVQGSWQELTLTVTTNLGLAGFMLYFLVSIVSLGLIPLSFTLHSRGVDLEAFTPGPLYYTNLAAIGVLSVLALLLALAQRFFGARTQRVPLVLALVVVVGFAGAAVYLGYEPLRQAVELAWRGQGSAH